MNSEVSNRPTVIIRRRKVVSAEGHHGGAWKVAYADFVTAMMAFFMMLWLLGATNDAQRKGIANYFAPAILVSTTSGGGDGLFGGNTAAAYDRLAFMGESLATGVAGPDTGATAALHAADADTAAQAAETAALDDLEKVLMGQGGESLLSDMALRHVVTRLTDEGLVVEIFSLPDAPLFVGETAEPAPQTREIVQVIAEVSQLVRNTIAVSAHVPAQPVVRVGEPVWPLSSNRAEVVRRMLGTGGVARDRIMRVTGHADRTPAVDNPISYRNDRVEVTFLRRN